MSKKASSLIEELFKGIDPELDRIVDEAISESKKFNQIDENKKLLEMDVYKEKTRIKYNIDDVTQMCVVANMAIDHILAELPRSKRKQVLMAAITGLEIRD